MENNNKSYIKKRESKILYRIIYRKTRMEGEDEGEHAFGGSRLSTICSYTYIYIYMCIYAEAGERQRGYINSDVGLINEPRNRRDLSSQR